MQYDSNNLLVFVFEIGLEWQKIASIRIKNVTIEFWKLLCLFCSYNKTSAVNCRGTFE